jgi:hydrogenase maturation protein HypF
MRAVIKITGAVQGVGFRPFVYRLARAHTLSGWVANDTDGVVAVVEGEDDALKRFIEELSAKPPPLAVIAGIETRYSETVSGAYGVSGFEILKSTGGGARAARILPDTSVCEACTRELMNPADRRHRYPFINCTDCGPRFSILENLPYDRQNTSMSVFQMCPKCLAEYEDPESRRFHAQPNSCHDCGPKIWFIDAKDAATRDDSATRDDTATRDAFATRDDTATRDASAPGADTSDAVTGEFAIAAALKILRAGGILAVKGVGGFHLACDAANESSVAALRVLKGRDQKPLAVMFRNFDEIESCAKVTPAEKALIESAARPIVIVEKRAKKPLAEPAYLYQRIAAVPPPARPLARPLAPSVCPGLDTVGVFLAYTPLHHLIMEGAGGPLVMTSANLSDEPIIKDNARALEKLRRVADGFLMHDRAILNHCDDSLIKIISGAPAFIRRSRGFAPLAATLPPYLGDRGRRVLALGAMQKNTIAIAAGRQAVISQHIGDLDTLDSTERFEETLERLKTLHDFTPQTVVYDMHPGYYQSREVVPRFKAMGIETAGVYHHHAHALCVMADNLVDADEEVLAVTWDGTGYGTDGCVWGGEFLVVGYSGFRRVFHFDYFRLIGGERAVKEPRRSALSLLFNLYGDDAFNLNLESLTGFSEADLRALHEACRGGFKSPPTSSVGRLFDAAACLLGIIKISAYEGQAGMLMERMYDPAVRDFYPYEIRGEKMLWQPIIEGLLGDGGDTVVRASRFINTLAEAAVEVVERSGIRGALSGGVFQNRALVERILESAKRRGISVLTHRQTPANDGGIAFGQLAYKGYYPKNGS